MSMELGDAGGGAGAGAGGGAGALLISESDSESSFPETLAEGGGGGKGGGGGDVGDLSVFETLDAEARAEMAREQAQAHQEEDERMMMGDEDELARVVRWVETKMKRRQERMHQEKRAMEQLGEEKGRAIRRAIRETRQRANEEFLKGRGMLDVQKECDERMMEEYRRVGWGWVRSGGGKFRKLVPGVEMVFEREAEKEE